MKSGFDSVFSLPSEQFCRSEGALDYGSVDKGPDARRQGASIAVWLEFHSRSAETQPPKQMGL
ncbi:MAG: hypothetical protein EA369_04050 [Bradymonadales bacterium]|nr:MAG: hypothetical protein EA369_04050 [Bradymonadales bacterium]